MLRIDHVNRKVPGGVCIPRNASRVDRPAPSNCPPGPVTPGPLISRLSPEVPTNRHGTRAAYIIGIIGFFTLLPEAMAAVLAGLAACSAAAVLYGVCSACRRSLYLKT